MFRLTFVFVVLAGFCLALPVQSAPYLGFVTVPGSLSHDDLGPDPRIIGEALKYSNATIIRAALDEAQHIPLLGRPGVGYVDGGTSSADLQLYRNLGYLFYIYANEPDGTALTNPNWAQDYMNSLNAKYPVIKGVYQFNQIIGGNLFTNNFDDLYNLGFKNVSDMIGFHNYSNDPATGISIDAVKPVRDEMVARGDSAKKIFLGEGWGPMRELPGLTRLFPDAQIKPAELKMLRDFVVNGYWSLNTSKSNYDPNWVFGALFFTLNDNWGGRHWAERAVPIYDGQGNIVNYSVDGYIVGLDIFAHFYNGGLIDVDGNAKDSLMEIFPGNVLALSNSGFEYWEQEKNGVVAWDWTPRVSSPSIANYAVDMSIRRGSQTSQRIILTSPGSEYVYQDTMKATASSGQSYGAFAWFKTWSVDKGADRGATIKMEFLNSSGSVVGSAVWATGLNGTNDWTRLNVSATAPSGTNRIRLTCGVYGNSGRVWIDDAVIYKGTTPANSSMTGYVLDTNRNPVSGATVQTTSGGYSATTNAQGYFSISGISPGVYDVTATKAGYSTKTARAQIAFPARTRPLGFHLTAAASAPTGVRVEDPSVGGVLKLSWRPPASAYDSIRIYRSTDPAQLGTLVHSGDLSSPVWDSGLSDGVKYSYTIRSVVNGVESGNTDNYYGISSGGVLATAYSYYPGAVFSHWSGNYGQTFLANQTGSIGSASCTPGFGGGGGTTLTFRIRQGGPAGAQIGPTRSKAASGDSECTVSWSPGEVPVIEGQTYYLQVTGAAGFAAYRGGNVYPNGAFFIDGVQQSGSDMWSTIKIVDPKSVVISDISAQESTPGNVTITWKTFAPASSQVEYGLTPSYGGQTSVDANANSDHSVVITGLKPGLLHHFRVKSNRSGIPDAVSLDYYFMTQSAAATASIAAAKSLADGAYIQLSGAVSVVGSGFYYLLNPEVPAGIRVKWNGSSPLQHQLLSVAGVLSTNADGERFIDATWSESVGNQVAAPVSMNNRRLAGEDSTGQAGVSSAVGLNNVGLYVRTWGKVTATGSGYFYLDDGSALEDGSGNVGVLCKTSFGIPPAIGSFVTVTGASSLVIINGQIKRKIEVNSIVSGP